MSYAKENMKEFLETAPLMQIATDAGSDMWIATVWFAMGDDGDIYFLSKKDRLHSQHIDKNPRVVCAISGQYSLGPGEKIQGVQMKGIASRVRLSEMMLAYKVYRKKWPQLIKIGTYEAFKGNAAGIHMYKVTPTKIVWFDEVNYPDQPRIEIL